MRVVGVDKLDRARVRSAFAPPLRSSMPSLCMNSYSDRQRTSSRRCVLTASVQTHAREGQPRRVSTGLHDLCDLGPREPLCPACQKRPLHRARTVLAVGPGDPLGHHTTPAAVDPPHPVEQHDRESPQGHELEPSRLPSSVVDRVLESAVRTDGFAAFARLHLNVDTVPHKAGRAVHEA